MRGIKFRGRICQGVENAGAWVYWGLNGTDMLDVIDPETIGQFIDSSDKNGKEMFEGDIVTNYSSSGSVEKTGPIKWDGDAYSWCGHCFIHTALGYCGGSFEVIGNIYENPEKVDA